MPTQFFSRVFSKIIIFTALLSAFSVHTNAQPDKTPEKAKVADQREIAEYTAAIKKSPEDVEAFYERGLVYLHGEEYESAMADFDRAISLNPKFDKAYSGRGYIYLQYKFYAEAIKEFNRAKELSPADSFAADNLIYIYQEIKRGGLTIEQYDKLIQLEPNQAEYYFGRSKLHHKKENFAKAIEDASKAIELKPDYTDVYILRADSYCKVGKRKESAADIAKYDQPKGKSIGAICRIDINICAKDDDDCRMSAFNDGISQPFAIGRGIGNGLGDYYVGRGILYYKRNDFERAFSDFKNAFDNSHQRIYEDENYFKARLYYGTFFLEKDKFDEALVQFEAALNGNKNSDELYFGIGQVYLIRRNYELALNNFEKALFLNPRLSKAYFGRGIIFYENGRNYGEFENDEVKARESYQNAVKDFDSVIEIDLRKTPPEVYLKRAKAYDKLGEQVKADADRTKYIELTEKP
ncbi:MAG: tetratricopeptide repeat protein [Pyrinomonadaceae bacterium]|nr:tetratricopeptide repeat protein [Pyrinomonadaceae bacterium]